MKKLFIIVLTAVLAVGLQTTNAQKELTKSFSGVKKIQMSSASGDCKIKKSGDAAITVHLKHTFDDSRFEPRIEQEEDRLVIREIFHGNNNSGEAEWTLTISDGIDVTLTTGSGNVQASDLTIDLTATSGSGNLVFANLKGDVDGTTGSGDVELDNFNGKINATTGSGDVRIEKSHGEISLICGSGNIRMTDSKAVISANTGSGSIAGRELTLEGSSKFNTGSGDAEIILAATPKYDLAVNSGSGDAEINFNGHEIVGEIVMKSNKKNGKIIAPFDFDKTEEIEEQWGDQVTVKKTALRGKGTNRISVSTGSGDAVLKK